MKKSIRILLHIIYAVLLLTVFCFVMFLLGFKITYASALEDDWGAIGAVAAWITALATCIIPIVVIVIDHKLSEQERLTGEANKAMLEEIKAFKSEYNDILYSLKNGEIIFDCGTSKVSDNRSETIEARILNYIRATVSASKQDIVNYFDLPEKDVENIINDLLSSRKIKRSKHDREKFQVWEGKMYEEYTHQSLPSKPYRELLGSAICVFNENTAFIIETILRLDISNTYDWYHLTDLEAGRLRSSVHNVISTQCGSEVETLFTEIIKQRNRIIHSYRITNASNQQVLATKEPIKDGNTQFEITEDYLIEFIRLNEKLNAMLHKLRGT